MMTLTELLDRANGEIIGIAPDLTISDGYDSPQDRANPGAECPEWIEPEDWHPMPKAEKIKLADLMLDRWTRYKAAVMEEPGA